MTISQIHAAAVAAYRQAILGSAFKDIKITAMDRETDDIHRGEAETEYDGNYSREMSLKVTTVNEDLYYYASSPKEWKIELNDFQELIEARLLKGVGDLEVTDISCESGPYGGTSGVLHIAFTLTDYEVIDFDGRETDADTMETLATDIRIET